MFFLCQYIKRVLSCFYISNRQMFQQHLLVFRKTDKLSSCICSGVQSWKKKKKRFHPKPSALTSTTICHKPICNFLGLFQLCALNIQDITGWITLHPRRITGKQDFFFPVKFLMSGTFSSFSTWCNDSSASVHFWQLRKNPAEVEERCPLIGRGMEIHHGNPFFVKFRSQSNTEKWYTHGWIKLDFMKGQTHSKSPQYFSRYLCSTCCKSPHA